MATTKSTTMTSHHFPFCSPSDYNNNNNLDPQDVNTQNDRM